MFIFVVFQINIFLFFFLEKLRQKLVVVVEDVLQFIYNEILYKQVLVR